MTTMRSCFRSVHGRRLAWLVLAILSGTVPGKARPPHLGQALGDLPDAVLWHLKVSYLLPSNFAAFERARLSAMASLEPGESADFDVLMRLGPDDAPLVFAGLVRSDTARITSADTCTVARLRLSQPRLVLCQMTRLASDRAFFESLRSHYPKMLARMGFEDFLVGERVWANTVGCREGRFYNVLDPTARAGGSGRIILVSKSGERTYRVFNVETGEVEEVRKGSKLPKLGTTVFLLMDARGAPTRRYVVVYTRLAKALVRPGAEAKAGQTVIGLFTREGSWEVWRVHGPEQYFLSPLDGSEPRPYRVAPVVLSGED